MTLLRFGGSRCPDLLLVVVSIVPHRGVGVRARTLGLNPDAFDPLGQVAVSSSLHDLIGRQLSKIKRKGAPSDEAELQLARLVR